jgi:hypothetical protein
MEHIIAVEIHRSYQGTSPTLHLVCGVRLSNMGVHVAKSERSFACIMTPTIFRLNI